MHGPLHHTGALSAAMEITSQLLQNGGPSVFRCQQGVRILDPCMGINPEVDGIITLLMTCMAFT